MYLDMHTCEELLCHYQVQWSQHMDSSHKMEISQHILHPWCRTECRQKEPCWVNREDEATVNPSDIKASQALWLICTAHRVVLWHGFAWPFSLALLLDSALSLFSVSQYPSLLTVMPVESQSTIKIPCKLEKFFELCNVYAVSIALTDSSFQVYENVSKICSLWLTLWRNLCCHDQWISDGLMPSFDINHVVYLCPDNCLPFCNWCPCALTTRLGNNSSCFSLARKTKTV